MARPKKEIDKEAFEKLCGLQCSEAEICSWFDVTDKTLTRWCKETYSLSFSEVFKQKRAAGKASLRRKQWKLADTSAAMAIFLGKNYLGQRDVQDIDFQDKTDKELLQKLGKMSLAELKKIVYAK